MSKSGSKDEATRTVRGREDSTMPMAAKGGKASRDAPSQAPTQGVANRAGSLFPRDEATRPVDSPDEVTGPGAAPNPTGPLAELGDERKTVVFDAARAGRTVPPVELPEDPMKDPPVGWLVVVQGPGRGSMLTLGYGQNQIGRSDGLQRPRVCLDYGDSKISRLNHATLVYDPRGRKYLLQPGTQSGLTYLAPDTLVQTPVELRAGATILIGDTSLRFVPLCGAEFDWS